MYFYLVFVTYANVSLSFACCLIVSSECFD
uniref:Uncharacterized protein n=1 Tax=Rhizophora mucronata TaxID=61149 RepID=A0A2P2IHF4_RHIMU